ncbi:unnamed protein product [Dibothriocephalus latus]|uniref:Uncharacterized protein n=1 Tax=Dibothriocephalus latus TaxID=60516 RepID=A0A3P7NUJ1_DIBLA|nr:unnamed protein product [Dibothriocephalus latus]
MSPTCSLLWRQGRRFPLIPFCVLLLLLLNALPSQTTKTKRSWSNGLNKGALLAEEDVLHVDDDPEDKEDEEPGPVPGPLAPADWKKRLRKLLKRLSRICRRGACAWVPLPVIEWPW